ncbi:hypothetical protein HDU85_000143 [Gaertneriomyces sp. JEL0708]|nr:hypothetical protein HDU85_000143 [Gaertneriomyces sp. JEL0708]
MELGMFIAYMALGLMAVVPIYYGSIAGLTFQRKPKTRKGEQAESDSEDESESEEPEFFSLQDAYMFPVIGSLVLVSLYLVFKFLNKEYLNALFTAYFSILGIGAVMKSGLAITRAFTRRDIKGEYRIDLWKHGKEIASHHFGLYHLFLFLVSVLIAATYATTKHWTLNNIYGEAFAASSIQLLKLDSFKTGIALLSCLFVYDVFWVFGTDVMVTVAQGFEAPIKVLWPKDIFELTRQGFFGVEKVQFTLLGLGDIVLPGIFVALCLQFDYHLYTRTTEGQKKPRSLSFSKPYFTVAMVLYILGLATTVTVMHVFHAAQPALLYLSPACIASVLVTGAFRGELKDVWAFAPAEEGNKKECKGVAAVSEDAAVRHKDD